jgi:aminoglycoside phosphotransferase (APT) family kinase protein
MTMASSAGIPVPVVIGERPQPDGLLLIEYLPGSSHQPEKPDPERARTIGAMAARIFAVPTDEVELPLVTHPIPSIDFGALRAESEPDPAMSKAEERIAEQAPPDPIGFTHGDLWSGNVLWQGAEIVGVLDWDGAGRAAAGVDLGSLRCDAAMCYGADMADLVLGGWEAEVGRPADSVAYWDVVAALSTPPDISWFAPAISGMTGRPGLTADILRTRRNEFLLDALDRLG